MNFIYTSQQEIEEQKIQTKGKPITCKNCKFQFRILDSNQKQVWKNSKLICPSCKSLYCVLPKTEAILQILQEEFLKNPFDKIISEKFSKILKSYTRSLILKNFTNVINEPEDIEYHTESSISKIFINYYGRSDFRIDSSFAAYMMFKVKESIWHKSEHDTGEHSIYETDETGNKLKYDVGKLCNFQQDSSMQQEREDTTKYIFKYLIELIYYNETLSFKMLISILNRIRYGELNIDRFYSNFGIEGKHKYLTIMNYFKKKLLELQKS